MWSKVVAELTNLSFVRFRHQQHYSSILEPALRSLKLDCLRFLAKIVAHYFCSHWPSSNVDLGRRLEEPWKE